MRVRQGVEIFRIETAYIMTAMERIENFRNGELEDGEVFSGEISNSVVDLDPFLSHMDDKISDVLGRFQNKFGSGVIKNGERLDEYGSFLPVYLREPSSLSKDDKISDVLGRFQKKFGSGVIKNGERLDEYGSFLPVYLREPSSLSKGLPSNGTVSVSPAVDVSGEGNSIRDSTFASEKVCQINDSSREVSEKKIEHKTLKVRIKLGSDKLLLRSNSPMDIPQIMKELEVPAEPMLSPLAENLLCLKEGDTQSQKGHNSEDNNLSASHEKVNLGLKKSNGIKLKTPRDDYKVSKKELEETLGIEACKDHSLSSQERKKASTEKSIAIEKNPNGASSRKPDSVPSNPLGGTATNAVNKSTMEDHVISDNWVCCDKCQKWRLLPHGANPNLLPKKWICAMLNWLPGMNKCSFSEDATTEALHALYQLIPNNGAIKTKQKQYQNQEPVINANCVPKPFKKKRKVIIDDSSLDAIDEVETKRLRRSSDRTSGNEHSGKGEIREKLEPTSTEDKSKVQPQGSLSKGPSYKHAASDFSESLHKERVPASEIEGSDLMIPSKKKRKRNPDADNQSNSHNEKKATIIKKVRKISSPVESVLPSPRRKNAEYCDIERDSDPQLPVKCNSGDERERNLSTIHKDTPKIVGKPKVNLQNSSGNQMASEIHPRNFMKKGASQSIVTAFKEAAELKNTADQLKAEGLERKGTALYFEAALKFLHVAILLEPRVTKNGNFEEAADHSISIYQYTAKLCGFCAQEYKKCNEMAMAALAFKCVEVAFMKAVFLQHSTASKDQRELKKFLCSIPLEESPSSSASDVDNLNGQSSLIRTLHNRRNILPLLNFVHDMNHAMEASKNSLIAYNHARFHAESSLTHHGCDGIASVKKALDFSFHDAGGLLHLIRLSMDAVGYPSDF